VSRKRLVREIRKLQTARSMAASTQPELPESLQSDLRTLLTAFDKLERRALQELGEALPVGRREL